MKTIAQKLKTSFLPFFLGVLFSIGLFVQGNDRNGRNIKPKLISNNLSILDTIEEKVYPVSEQAPVYPGGIHELSRIFSRSLKPHLPKEISRDSSNKLLLHFIVEKNGFISQLKVIRVQELGGDISEAANSTTNQLRKFAPGKIKKNPVRVFYDVPLNFATINSSK